MVDITKTSSKTTIIATDDGFRDVFAEGVGVTRYNINGQDLVNITFLSHKLLPHVDGNGAVVNAKVEPLRVASITMTLHGAIAFREALNQNLESVISTREGQQEGKKS